MYHLLALLGAHPILHVSRIRVNARNVEHIIVLYCGLETGLITLPSLWKRVLIGKLTVAQLVKKFIAFYGT
jgi:hypothetical protein